MESEVGGGSNGRQGAEGSVVCMELICRPMGVGEGGGVGAVDDGGRWYCRDRRGADVSGWLRSQAWRRRRSDRDGECSRQRGTRNEEMRNVVEGNES